MTQHARRAAVISTSTLVLCLAGAAPALAGTGDPVPSPDPGPVLHTLKPVIDMVDPVIPVRTLAHGVTQQAGLDDPLATPRPRHKHHKPAQHQPASTPTSQRPEVRGTTHQRPTTHPAATDSGNFGWRLSMARLDTLGGGASVVPQAPPVPAPAVAASPVQRITNVAAQAVSGLDPRTPLGRTVLVILGTMLIGLLSGGHLKNAQDRLVVRPA